MTEFAKTLKLYTKFRDKEECPKCVKRLRCLVGKKQIFCHIRHLWRKAELENGVM